jgi:hypothetical protein
MATYVTSLSSNARRAHLGSTRLTACGTVLVGRLSVGDTIPADRAVCPACLDVAVRQGTVTRADADALLAAHGTLRPRKGRSGFSASDIAALAALYKTGANDKQAALALGISVRAVVRRAAQGMDETGAVTRFQWGYLLGRADRDAS